MANRDYYGDSQPLHHGGYNPAPPQYNQYAAPANYMSPQGTPSYPSGALTGYPTVAGPQQHNYGPPYPITDLPQPQYSAPPIVPVSAGDSSAQAIEGDGERGLGATVLGGASGAFLAKKTGGGVMATMLGSVAGAIGANILENKHKKSKDAKEDKEKKHNHRHRREGGSHGSSSYGGSTYGGSAVGGLYPGHGEKSRGHGHEHGHRHGTARRHASRSRSHRGSFSSSDSD